MPTSGGIYGYVEAALGPLAGYIAGTLLWVGDAPVVSSVAAALADVAVSLVPTRPGFDLLTGMNSAVLLTHFAPGRIR